MTHMTALLELTRTEAPLLGIAASTEFVGIAARRSLNTGCCLEANLRHVTAKTPTKQTTARNRNMFLDVFGLGLILELGKETPPKPPA